MNRKVCTLTVLACLCAWPTEAELFGVPTSNNIMSGKFLFGDLPVASFCSREGTIVRVIFDAHSSPMKLEAADITSAFVFKEIADSTATRMLLFSVSDLDGGQNVRQLGDSQVVAMGKEFAVPPQASIRVMVKGWKEGQFATKPVDNPLRRSDVSSLQKDFGQNDCCVYCNGIQVCAGAVSLGCGYCESSRELKGCF